MEIRRAGISKRTASPEARFPTFVTPGMRRFAIAIAGFSVLLFGVALLVVPVPGTTIIVLPLGLAILAREFKWARRLLERSTAAVKLLWAGVRRLFAAVSGPHVGFLPLRVLSMGPRPTCCAACCASSGISRTLWRRGLPAAGSSQRRS